MVILNGMKLLQAKEASHTCRVRSRMRPLNLVVDLLTMAI